MSIYILLQLTILFFHTLKKTAHILAMKKTIKREKEREKDDKLNNRTAITTKYYITGAIRAK